jgi:hypothetical protein
MTTASSDRGKILADMSKSREALLASLEGLSDDQMTRPAVGDWSVKDLLAHLACWEEFSLLDVRRLARGAAPALAAFDIKKVDEWNGMLMSLRRHFSLEQARSELKICRQMLLDAVAELPDSALAEGQFGRNLLSLSAFHDRGHEEDIRNWRKREGL